MKKDPVRTRTHPFQNLAFNFAVQRENQENLGIIAENLRVEVRAVIEAEVAVVTEARATAEALLSRLHSRQDGIRVYFSQNQLWFLQASWAWSSRQFPQSRSRMGTWVDRG